MKKTINSKIYYKGLKKCNRCEHYKPFETYPKSNSTLDGKYSFCKECLSESNRWKYKTKNCTPEARIKQKISRDKYKAKLKELGVTKIKK